MRFEPKQAVLADLHDALGAGKKPDHQRPRELLHLGRQRHARHQRHVAGLDAAIGEIDRSRRFRGARDADQHHVGVLQPFDVLAVIMKHRVVERIDALEIFRVEHVLGADPVDGLGAEIGLEQTQHRPQHRHARQREVAAFLFQRLDQVFLEQRVQHQARRLGDFRQRVVELLLGAHHRVKMFDRRYIGILRRSSARDRDQRFAGRVGNEMEMEITGVGHLYSCRTACGQSGRRPRLYPPRKLTRTMSSFSIHMAGRGTLTAVRFGFDARMWMAAWGRVGIDR